MAESKNIPADLPTVIPIFPLPKVILFPESNLPLNIFETRYLKMIDDATATHGIIGMIQPQTPDGLEGNPDTFKIGGAGRVTHQVKTDDGRYLIRLTGISRFEIDEELAVTTPYRQAKVNWDVFDGDTLPEDHTDAINRESLMSELRLYLEAKGLEADYDGINAAPDSVLVNTLSMIIPLTISEKQALIETPTTVSRANTLRQLLMMITQNHKVN